LSPESNDDVIRVEGKKGSFMREKTLGIMKMFLM
jgi:hypothetical protein